MRPALSKGVRWSVSCLWGFKSGEKLVVLLIVLLFLNELCSYPLRMAYFLLCELCELVVAVGFLGASLNLLDFSSGSTPPHPSIEEPHKIERTQMLITSLADLRINFLSVLYLC